MSDVQDKTENEMGAIRAGKPSGSPVTLGAKLPPRQVCEGANSRPLSDEEQTSWSGCAQDSTGLTSLRAHFIHFVSREPKAILAY